MFKDANASFDVPHFLKIVFTKIFRNYVLLISNSADARPSFTPIKNKIINE